MKWLINSVFALLIAGLALTGAPAKAQQPVWLCEQTDTTSPPGTSCVPTGVTAHPLVASTSIAPTTATSAQTKVTITTAGTYQQYLASNTSRKGCTIQFITALHTGYVFFGSAPADMTTSFQLSAGQTLNCNAGGVVLTDAIQLTSSNNSDVFVVNSY